MRLLTLVFLLINASNLLIAQKLKDSSSSTLNNAALQWKQAMDLRNADLTVAAFDSSIVAIYHSNPLVKGKDANNKVWQSVFADSSNRHPITIDKVDVAKSGDMGYVYGKWWSIRPTINYYNGGRYVAVWKLIDQKWKMVMLSVNIQEDVKAERQHE